MSEASNRKFIRWIGITLAVMFILPFAVAKLVSEYSGMALCMMLFFCHRPQLFHNTWYCRWTKHKSIMEPAPNICGCISCRSMDIF